MRRVERIGSVPSNLESANKGGKTERDRARDHQLDTNPKKGSFTYAGYKHDDVKRKLAALFHNKCAYCETFFSASAPVDIEHYRPKGSVADDPAHPGYWWLAMSWDNLLPSCIDCNRKRKQYLPDASTSLKALYDSSTNAGMNLGKGGKQDSFPIRDSGKRLAAESYAYIDEEPLLLDPTRDDPREHLRFSVDHTSPVSLVLAGSAPGRASDRGAMSIQTYGLNRLGLVQDRTRLLRRLEFLGEMILDLGITVDELKALPAQAALDNAIKRLEVMQGRMLMEIKEMAAPKEPYSEMVGAWLNNYIEQLKA
ncbi:HNH endonuclease [Pseudomonas syringae Cit 7]|uniref:HNH endonuclease n=2 Tax=Pseudomonas syringae TaxID=317 RepID=A0A8T8LTI6_PSESX|nr:HNH endonuclease [Pseudomonas syringae]MDU8419686.1 HNH endonuclease [Pseudomonas syringae]PBP68231.1 HNH endonuclease [Pseudomonas syringae]QUP64811.1 HNH endonuclease [Pseudomonas syringae Cit 7]RMS56248.1 HNH nuclease [Pseudomonas syringae pv. aceris]RMS68736.1 HNH nuclease [Pseudomonas syringae pv. aceris]